MARRAAIDKPLPLTESVTGMNTPVSARAPLLSLPTPRRSSGLLRGALLLLLALLPLHSGCAAFVENVRPVIYGKTAKDNYERGLRSLRGESYQDAAKYFQHVMNNYSLSRWATLSELGLADAALGRESYTEAIDSYQAFMRSHPSHESTTSGYCSFKVAEAYHKQIPGDFFLLPPSYEKDQGAVYDAMRQLAKFVDEYGDTKYAEKARKLYAETVRRLADHELYVARFYLDRDRTQAAIWRLEYVVDKYPGARREAEVLLLLGQVYLKQKKPREARDTFRRLRVEHPADYRAQQAQLYLDYIARNFPNLPPPGELPKRKAPAKALEEYPEEEIPDPSPAG